jgi:hypothetical protein
MLVCGSALILIWFETCSIHALVRVLVAHLDRYNLKKPMSSISRLMKIGRYHDKWMQNVGPVVRHLMRWRRGLPPSTSPSPEARTELMRILLLDEQQRLSATHGPHKASLEASEKHFHLRELLKLLNFSVFEELIWHYCNGCCANENDTCAKIT